MTKSARNNDREVVQSCYNAGKPLMEEVWLIGLVYKESEFGTGECGLHPVYYQQSVLVSFTVIFLSVILDV